MIQESIVKLVQYGLATGLVEKEDKRYTTNKILELLQMDAIDEEYVKQILESDGADQSVVGELESILGDICDYAYEHGLMEENSVGYRDLFDTKVMSLLVDRPSNVIRRFWELYKEDPVKATDAHYKFSQDTDYIRRYRIAKDMKWVAPTEYGDLDITINLSKPEKDPKAIAAAKLAKQTSYPKCLLCMENEGYAGRLNHPARQNHRIIPVTINNSEWGFQYSPYVYYNEHCIVFNSQHVPMKIERATFAKLFDFVKQFPHYFVGSNADLVKWPMSVIRISGPDTDRLIELADKILLKWRGYTDEAAFIFAETDGEPHNTITPIARKRGDMYEMDLVLRNNITTEEHPLGVYHPHAELHHIKKENIGLIEVMGLAVLPARLKGELEGLCKAIVAGEDLRKDEVLEKHADWVDELKEKYTFTAENVEEILKKEIGIVFKKVLEHAGVYKCTEEGRTAFMRFIDSL